MVATMSIMGIRVFGSYDYLGSSGKRYRTIMVLMLFRGTILYIVAIQMLILPELGSDWKSTNS